MLVVGGSLHLSEHTLPDSRFSVCVSVCLFFLHSLTVPSQGSWIQATVTVSTDRLGSSLPVLKPSFKEVMCSLHKHNWDSHSVLLRTNLMFLLLYHVAFLIALLSYYLIILLCGNKRNLCITYRVANEDTAY